MSAARSLGEGSGRSHGVAAVIPARLESRRFPRKVLARETGKYLIEHVYERVAGCPGVDVVVIATDSQEVVDACRSFGVEAVLTSVDHASGTDRVAEIARGLPHGIVINVQGDEPLIGHADLQTLVRLFSDGDGVASEGVAPTVMTTLAAVRLDPEGFLDPNVVKVVLAEDGHALYFSRSAVPHGGYPGSHPACLGAQVVSEGKSWLWYQHVGIYAYRREFLLELTQRPPTPLERQERLEQLRVLEYGCRIRVGITSSRHLGIDTEEEYRQFVTEYRGR